MNDAKKQTRTGGRRASHWQLMRPGKRKVVTKGESKRNVGVSHVTEAQHPARSFNFTDARRRVATTATAAATACLPGQQNADKYDDEEQKAGGGGGEGPGSARGDSGHETGRW